MSESHELKSLERTIRFLAVNWLRIGEKCPKGETVIFGVCPGCTSPQKPRNPFCRMALQWHKQMELADQA
jgi:hypothetical protein